MQRDNGRRRCTLFSLSNLAVPVDSNCFLRRILFVLEQGLLRHEESQTARADLCCATIVLLMLGWMQTKPQK